MLKLGKTQKLRIGREKDFGVYLEDSEGESVLLPIRQLPAGKKVGDELLVFVYRDSRDRLIATTETPLMEVGEVARVRVSDITPIGAFVSIGLEKEVLIPHREMRYELKKGQEVEVYLYVDHSGRLAASTYTKKREDARHIEEEERKRYHYERDAEKVLHILESKFSGQLPYTDKEADPERIARDFGLSKAAFKRAIGKLLKEERVKITKPAIFCRY